jgi:hypothetical protein
MNVGIMASTSSNAPRNFPFTICQRLRVLLKVIPAFCFFSSAKLRIVMAGIRKIKIQGAKVKNGDISAKPVFKRLQNPKNNIIRNAMK